MIRAKPSSVSYTYTEYVTVWLATDSKLWVWFSVDVEECSASNVMILQLSTFYLKCQNPKITSSVTLSRIISTGTRDFRFSYVWTDVLLILWCWLPNFISIKKNYTQNYIRPQAALILGIGYLCIMQQSLAVRNWTASPFLLYSAECLL